jgi:hypothetical protein
MLSDNQLALLEQLTYIKEAADAVGVTLTMKPGDSIEDILKGFSEEKLKQLEKQGKALGSNNAPMGASGAEWASIIRNLKTDKSISSLVLSNTMVSGKDILAYCFYDKSKPNDAIVVFKGTTGGNEWIDNVEGLNTSDTKAQKEALDWMESLRFTDITVVGHSKGGNKAMYVAILSDKVTRCVAMDGQGFSQEFLDKYWAEIQAKAGIINSYSVSTDFVNILMFPIPGANLVFVQGYGIDSLGENHAPNSFFITDSNGNLLLDADGNPQMDFISQDESLKMVHEFTIFLMNLADAKDKKLLVEFISQLLAKMFGNPPATMDEILDYALAHQDTLELIIAYLIKYMDVYDYDEKDIYKLVEALGLNGLDEMFKGEVLGVKIDGFAAVLGFLKKHLNDGESDPIIEFFLSFVNYEGINGKELWKSIESKINKIGKVDPKTANQNAKSKTGVVRDFSKSAYDALINTISRFENNGFEGVSSWNNYSGEDWFSSLFINIAVKGINSYMNKLTETSSKCRTRIDAVFNNVSIVDGKFGNKINNGNIYLRGVKATIADIADSIA